MIERFLAALAAMRAAGPEPAAGTGAESHLADWADAVRLQIDCMQQELDVEQRSALHRLLEGLEADPPNLDAIARAAVRASRLLGLSA